MHTVKSNKSFRVTSLIKYAGHFFIWILWHSTPKMHVLLLFVLKKWDTARKLMQINLKLKVVRGVKQFTL